MVVPTVTFDPTLFEGMIDNFSKSLTYYPVTKTTDSITGQETLTAGTATTIYGHVFLKKNVYVQSQEGLVQGGDATLIVKKDVTINKNDLVVFAGVTYRIDNVTMRYLDQTEFYQAADLFITDSV
jgi:hypothetical protein